MNIVFAMLYPFRARPHLQEHWFHPFAPLTPLIDLIKSYATRWGWKGVLSWAKLRTTDLALPKEDIAFSFVPSHPLLALGLVLRQWTDTFTVSGAHTAAPEHMAKGAHAMAFTILQIISIYIASLPWSGLICTIPLCKCLLPVSSTTALHGPKAPAQEPSGSMNWASRESSSYSYQAEHQCRADSCIVQIQH